jgi:hypothetical protein
MIGGMHVVIPRQMFSLAPRWRMNVADSGLQAAAALSRSAEGAPHAHLTDRARRAADLSIPVRAIRRYDDAPDWRGHGGRPRMQYLLLIYEENRRGEATPEDWQRMAQAYGAYGQWLRDKGWLRGGEALADVSDATTVQVRDGKRIITDGPFAETKEILGGYFLIDAPDLDSAIEAAERLPGASTGKVEIRPIVEMP